MAGLVVTGIQLNQLCGNIALNLKHNFTTAVDINNWLLAHPVVGGNDPLVTTYGLTQPDADTIRSALADLAFMKTSAFDSSSPVKQLWGLGE